MKLTSLNSARLGLRPKFFRLCYNELGDLYLDKLNKHRLTRNLVHRLARLGYTVTLEQKAALAA